MKMLKDHNLYLVTGREYSVGRSTLEVATSAVSGGIDILQMREKGVLREELIELGSKLSALCKNNDVVFIVNDDPSLVKEVDADGVHLGQEDIKEYSVDQTRRILGEGKIIGISTHSVEQFEKANESDVDYIAFGPIFHTKTKDYTIGTGDVGKVLDIAAKPVIFIGGIDLDNVDVLLEKGARNIAVIRAIAQAEDIAGRVKEFKNKMRR